MNTLVIDDSATEQRLALATELLESSSGIVVLDGVVIALATPKRNRMRGHPRDIHICPMRGRVQGDG